MPLPPAGCPGKTIKILISGMVQGVGFRPHLYRLAMEHGLRGEVANSLAGVELILEGNAGQIALLLDSLQASPPPGAAISAVHQEQIAARQYPAFTIGPSRNSGSLDPLAPADMGMCAACQGELLDPANHRYQHPFISCTACGPRFTLMEGLPYDRPLTAMAAFPLCRRCQQEYQDPASRRFHAEPICCPGCGPRLCLYDKNGPESKSPLAKTAALLKEGQVVAIKGVGGFHLAADACSDEAVTRLRAAKQRMDKPLAVMVRDLESAAGLVWISPPAGEMLSSPARPIVILPAKNNTPLSRLIAPGLTEVGIMLAYTPLHYLLFDQGPQVLVMTSFNEPGNPMLIKTSEALARLGVGCDAVLSHNRQIVNRCDDSLFRMHDNHAQILRRSRGYAPLPVPLTMECPAILACGGQEKVTICLTRGKRAFVSQHLGENSSPASYRHYQEATGHLQALLRLTPHLVARDRHPGYQSSRFALAQPARKQIAVQHHHAHIASCMAENSLDHPVLGLALDGTGLGQDGTIWGGEILLCTLTGFRRLAHFVPLAMAGGDMAVTEPWRLALAWLHREGWHHQHQDLAFLKAIPQKTKELLIEMLDKKLNSPLTSSLGRLFDAVAALINLRSRITFGAQAAMELEAICTPGEEGVYPFDTINSQDKAPRILETRGLLQGIIADLERGTPAAVIASRFHNTIIQMLTAATLVVAREEGIREVACSGGVFQNRLISEGLQKSLAQAGLRVYCHQKIPCNDGGLALGQAVVAAALYHKKEAPPPPFAESSHA